MSGPAHSWTATMPDWPPPGRGRRRGRGARWSGVSRSRAAARTTWCASAVSGRCGSKPARGRQARRQPPQRRGRRRGVDVDPRQVGRPVADHGVQVVGGRRRRFAASPTRPSRAPRSRPSGWAACVLGDERKAVPQRGGGAQVEARQREAGGGDVDVAVDECGRDERAVEIDDLGVGELRAADVVAAEPRDDAVADRHRGGVGHGRAVHPAADQQRRQLSRAWEAAGGRCHDVDGVTVDVTVDDVDDLAVDVVAASGGRPAARSRWPRR